jgi:hypothetical protein
MEPLNPISPPVEQPRIIPWEEQLQDHNEKIEEYLRNLVFRGCTFETTVKKARVVLKRLFERAIAGSCVSQSRPNAVEHPERNRCTLGSKQRPSVCRRTADLSTRRRPEPQVYGSGIPRDPQIRSRSSDPLKMITRLRTRQTGGASHSPRHARGPKKSGYPTRTGLIPSNSRP